MGKWRRLVLQKMARLWENGDAWYSKKWLDYGKMETPGTPKNGSILGKWRGLVLPKMARFWENGDAWYSKKWLDSGKMETPGTSKNG
jgi:hypothetical protein